MKNGIVIKLTSVLLAALMLPALSACSQEDAGTTSDTTVDTTASVDTSGLSDLELRELIEDNLPEVNYKGRDYRIYAANEGYSKCFYVETSDGEVVNDAIVKAINKTEERFGVDISVLYSSGDGHPDIVHNQSILNLIKADDNIFEIAENHDSFSGSASIDGNYINLLSLEYLDFTKPWWVENSVNSLTYKDQLYLGSSMMSYRGLYNTRVLFFNKGLLEDYDMDTPYETILAGDWTLDYFSAQVKDIFEDLDANGQQSDGDRYGYIADHPIWCYIEAYGIPAVAKSEDALTPGVNSPKTVIMIEKLYNLIYESKGVTIQFGGDYANPSVAATMFSNNQALYTYGTLREATEIIRYSNLEYGIIPTPKFDENQEKYLAAYTDRFFVIPQTTRLEDYDFVSIILESMSAEGYRKVYPAFFEIALKLKYTTDDESMQMLDLINECRILDFGYVYCNEIRAIIHNLLAPTGSPSTNFSSEYKKHEQSILDTLEKVYIAFDEMSKK